MNHPEPISGHPQLGLGALFVRFLRFGALAWGGPVAQISMLREELVDRENWVSGNRFNRVLGVYQVLPGPEAAELCIWFGQLVRGRLGGLVAGLGFILPGFFLMLTLTWTYLNIGTFEGREFAALLAMQVAAIALVARGAWKIGTRSLADKVTIAIAIVAAAATFMQIHFAIVLLVSGVALEIARRWKRVGWLVVTALATSTLCFGAINPPDLIQDRTPTVSHSKSKEVTNIEVASSGLRAGSLTFGGAYTVIPFLRHDAVERGGWLTDEELLQGLALGSVLPAPLIIFATFVGWLANGFVGALIITIAIFTPAFVITLIGHSTLERIVDNTRVHDFLDGVMAGVVGLIATTSVLLTIGLVDDFRLLGILLFAITVLWRWNSMLAIPAVMLGAAIIGAIIH